ncbi:MAG: hypothetical protein R3D00_05000 [Bacteroidia bacterium]
MKRLTFILIIGILVACTNNSTSLDKQENVSTDSAEMTNSDTNVIVENDNKRETTFYFKDSTKYSQEWIKEFKERHRGYKSVQLIDDTIIINNDRKDFITLPTDLPIDSEVYYELIQDGSTFSLTVKRINYTTIEYRYADVNTKKEGLAHIEPVFYFGAEGVFEDDDGMTYGMNEYIDNSQKDCWTYIYVGMQSINKTFLKHGCETHLEKLTTPLLTRKE